MMLRMGVSPVPLKAKIEITPSGVPPVFFVYKIVALGNEFKTLLARE
jgi:hypothetical protein